jgi:hypothetical protein
MTQTFTTQKRTLRALSLSCIVTLNIFSLILESSAWAYPPGFTPLPPPHGPAPRHGNTPPPPGPGFGGAQPHPGTPGRPRQPGYPSQPGHPGQPGGGTGFQPVPGGPHQPIARRNMPPHVRVRPIVIEAPRYGNENDRHAAEFFQTSFAQARCEQIGDALRRLSNQILSSSNEALYPPNPGNPNDLRHRLREEHRKKMAARFRDPEFWQRMWTRLADVYRSCDLGCFDDGQAVGEISAAGYCGASVQLGGLPSPSFLDQPPLPLCENSIFVGCQQSYRSTAASTPGCAAFTSGNFAQTFNESISQDCHLDL